MTKTLTITKDNLDLISKSTEWKYSAWMINTLIKTSFPTLESVEEAVVAFQLAAKYNLDPAMKQMFAWKDNRWNMVCIASAAWFMKIARSQKWFISISAHSVYPDEDFSLDTGSWIVSHKINPAIRSWKKPLWAYARLEMEWKEPQVKWVNWDEYYVKKSFATPWDNQSSAMIEKTAISVLLRQALWLDGLYWMEEMEKVMDSTQIANSNDVNKETTLSAIEKREQELMWNKKEEAEIIEAETE